MENDLTKVIKDFLLALAPHYPPLIGIVIVLSLKLFRSPIVVIGFAAGAGVYELLVLFWKGIGIPVWHEVWEQGNFKIFTVNVLADWARAILLNLFSGFHCRYRQQVLYDHRVFPVKGLLTPGLPALEVEQVFVELQIAPSHAMQVSANPIEVKSLPGSQPVWTFLRRIKKKTAAALAILGPPGCGKTTLLKHTALHFAARRHRKHHLRPAIPLLLLLREHASVIVNESPPLAEIVQRYYNDQKRYPELKPPPYWFACQLRRGKCLILLDGLDEVVDAAQRQTITTWVDQQICNYPRCGFILTARPQGYRDNPSTRAQVLEALPFNDEQVRHFVCNWYLAKKLIEHGRDDRGVRQDAEREAQDLLKRLSEKKHLKELTVNPLLLTMIANVHNYRGVLPDKRVNLYTEICEVLLGHWQQAKGVADRLDARQKRVVLQPLAEAMMRQKTRDFPTKQTIKVITQPLLKVGIAARDIDTFLKEAPQATSGLLVEKEAGIWGFAHFTFQEYLCAAHWAQTGEAADWDTHCWQAFIGESWWHETLRLYAAQADADTLVDVCLSMKTDDALKLASDIAREALTLSSPLRGKITKSMKGLVVVRLRSEPMTVSEDNFLEVFKLDKNWRPLEYIENKFEDKGEVVVDQATGLMWQKSGSTGYLTYEKAHEYVRELNDKKFAGYNDWRLPTIPELVSLLEPERQENDLYINPVFDKMQKWCWSADLRSSSGESSSGSAWLVYFGLGHVGWDGLRLVSYYVRVVRSWQ